MNWIHLPRIALLVLAAVAVVRGEAAPAGGLALGSIVDAVIRPLCTEHAVPGLAVGLTIDGKSYFFSYGVAAKTTGALIDEETLFEIGSVSKMFTSTLAAYALERGKLSLEDHPSVHLPRLQGAMIDRVKLLHLATYTAGGLPLQFPADVSSEDELMRYFRQWQPDFAPGEQRRYSNPSIGLLGHLTALALKTDFIAAVESQLLPALGLSQTYLRVPEAASARYAWGYDAAGQPVRVNPGVLDAEAYGIKTTARDLLRFVQLNLDPAGIDGPMRSAVEHTHRGYYQIGEMVQGLGWEQYPYPVAVEQLLVGNSRTMIFGSNPALALTAPPFAPERTFFNKTGSTNGFGAYVAFVPGMRIGIVLLANKNYPIPARIKAAHAILESVQNLRATK